MPSIELSKLHGIGALRAAAEDRAQIEARHAEASRPSARTASAAGISVEVQGSGNGVAAPVDAERVAAIRDALRDGTYPLVPAKIADAMIAAQISLTLPEQD